MHFPQIGLALLLAATLLPTGTFASPHPEGVVREINLRYPDSLAATEAKKKTSSPIRWKEIIKQPGTEFIRLHLIAKFDQRDAIVQIQIKDYKDEPVFQYSPNNFPPEGDLWTGVIYGNTAKVEIISDSQPQGLQFAIKEYAYQSPGFRILSIIQPDERDPIVRYKNEPALILTSKAIAKLSVIKDGGLYSCTGFMISPDLLMTNEHCVNSQIACSQTVALFGYELTEVGNSLVKRGQEFRCRELASADYDLDYALIRLDGSPGSSSQWGSLPFGYDTPIEGQPILIIQHPAGEPKQISRRGCAVKSKLVDGRGALTDFGHTCDTLGGSSGSPVLNERHQVIGLHHLGTSAGRWANENRAVRMELIACKLRQDYSIDIPDTTTCTSGR